MNPHKWLAHYEKVGWMAGRNKMKDWKAGIRYWEQTEFDNPKKQAGNMAAPTPGKYDGIGEKA